MKTTFTALTALSILAWMPTAASANEKHMESKVDYYLSKMDTDGNKSVSKTEHDAFGQKMFTEADANKDNMLSRDELLAHKKEEKAAFKGSAHNDDDDSE